MQYLRAAVSCTNVLCLYRQGEMLGFVGSKSKPYVLKEDGIVAFPDENYAREIMQLFSIGIHQLEMDGTLKLDTDGSPILSYSAEDIQVSLKIAIDMFAQSCS